MPGLTCCSGQRHDAGRHGRPPRPAVEGSCPYAGFDGWVSGPEVRHNINVNAILPRHFPSKLSEGLSSLGDALRWSTPLGHVGGDEDMKGVTGAAIPVDGGVTLV